MASFMGNTDVAYAPVPQHVKPEVDDLEDGFSRPSSEGSHPRRYPKSLGSRLLSVIPWIIIASLAILNVHQWRFSHDRQVNEEIYSPAQPAIRYKNVLTSAGIVNDISPYQGRPSNKTDSLWKDLYNFGLTRISMDEASKLVNRTVPIPEEPGNYMVTLNVFHHLHCLNMIRKRIWHHESGLEAPSYGPMGIIHMDHCIDGIRQALMCAGDVTPRPYGWDPLGENVVAVNHVMRTCRDFDTIREWARPRQVHNFNYSVHVEDPLGNVYIEEALRKAWPEGMRPEGQ